MLSSKEGDEADGAGVGWETVLGPQQRHPKQNPRDEGTSWRARGGGAASDRWRHGAARRPEAAKPVAADGAGLEGMASGSFLPARVQEAGIRTSRVLSAREGRLGASAVEDGFVGAAADEESPTPPSGDGWLAQAHEFVRLRHPKVCWRAGKQMHPRL